MGGLLRFTIPTRFAGLCVPPILLALLDCALTLAGQSKEYWSGKYAAVNEMSPTFNHLLAYHPAAFVLGFVVYLLVVVGLIGLMPQTLALATSIGFTLGHMVGAATWILYRFKFGYQACNGLFLFTAIALAVCIRWGWLAEPRFDKRIGEGWPFVVRWLVIGILFGIIVYLFLWPRHS